MRPSLAVLALALAAPALALEARDGARLVRLTRPSVGADESGIQHLRAAGGRLFFTARQGSDRTRYRLWRTTGRPRSTVAVPGIAFPDDPSTTESFAVSGGKLFFTLRPNGNAPPQLRVTDGRRRGTRFLLAREADNLTDFAGTLFFSTREGEAYVLWKSDGTQAGTVQVAEITPWTTGAYAPSRFAGIGSRLFFYADDGTRTLSLRALDVAPAVMPAPVTPVPAGNGIADLAGVALVQAPYRLERSDGTPEGTTLVVETTGTIHDLIVVGGRAFFTVYEGGDSTLWSSDGTPAGTAPVPDLPAGPPGVPGMPGSGSAIPIGARPGELFVMVGADAPELWRTGGTTSERVAGLPAGHAGEFGATVGAVVFFVLQDLANGNRAIWRTDGTAAGTVQVTAEEDARGRLGSPRNLLAFGDLLAFTTFTGGASGESFALWALQPR